MGTNYNIFAIKHNHLLPDKGSILISEPFMKDVYFQRSVVLLVEHQAEGSMGFILNKKTELIVNHYFPAFSDLPDMPLYLGGPVHSNRLFFIHTLGEELIPGTMKIKDGICFDGEFDVLKELIRQGYPMQDKVKFFLGYAGWTKDQLSGEIKSDSWLVSHTTDSENIVKADGDLFWKKSLEQMGSKYITWTKFPKDPDLN